MFLVPFFVRSFDGLIISIFVLFLSHTHTQTGRSLQSESNGIFNIHPFDAHKNDTGE